MSEMVFGSPLLIYVPTVPALYQGHGPACRWWRHTLVGCFAISTIGRPVDVGALPSPYETRVFRVRDGQYEALERVVQRRSELAARAVHKMLVQSAVRLVQGEHEKTWLESGEVGASWVL